MERLQIAHPIPPVYDAHSKVLILGSFPSVKSRESAFFYGHPQNRFWRVLASLYEEPLPETAEEKRALLLRRRIALWDVIASCSIEGSSDSTIRGAVPNDLRPILRASGLRRIFVNGRTAEKLYRRYLEPETGIRAVCLPSTSPANAAWDLERLKASWRQIACPIGDTLHVAVDRPLGSRHPEHPDLLYPVNYGYAEGVTGGDGEAQDVYILGAEEPLSSFTGRLIAVVHRLDDEEDKWVAAPEGMHFSPEEIRDALHFQEQYFHSELWL